MPDLDNAMHSVGHDLQLLQSLSRSLEDLLQLVELEEQASVVLQEPELVLEDSGLADLQM